MLGIKINNEYLELNPGTQLELESENPFLQFGDDIIGEYSLPFEVAATPTNLRLLEFAGLLQKRIDNRGIDSAIYDNGLQQSVGKIKIEKPQVNLNSAGHGRISLYYLSGVASFYQDIKDRNLREIEMGGDRTFSWDNYNRAGTGFWGHIHKVVDAPAGYGTSGYDYAFYPVINKSYQWDPTPGITITSELMNRMVYTGGQVSFSQFTTDGHDGNVIVPFPYLLFVLKQVCANIGWNLSGDILSDADFKKVTLINFSAIDWASFSNRRLILNNVGYLPLQSITFNLQDNVPDWTLADLFINLKKRFGWWYDFDRKSKTIIIRSLTTAAISGVKDFTAQASPLVVKTVNKDPHIYALKNQFESNYADGAPNLKALTVDAAVNRVADLPAATATQYNHVRMVITENNYYVCRESETNPGVFTWQFYAYNVYDYEPDGANEEVTTRAVTIGCEKYDTYHDFIPRIDNDVLWPGRIDTEPAWGVILAFYHGKRANKLGQPVPFAGSSVYDSAGVQVAQWSLAFECKKTDGTDVGLYETQWKALLTLVRSAEELEVTLALDKVNYLNLKFSDVISIAGVRMYIKTIKAAIPYKNTLVVEGVRI